MIVRSYLFASGKYKVALDQERESSLVWNVRFASYFKNQLAIWIPGLPKVLKECFQVASSLGSVSSWVDGRLNQKAGT